MATHPCIASGVSHPQVPRRRVLDGGDRAVGAALGHRPGSLIAVERYARACSISSAWMIPFPPFRKRHWPRSTPIARASPTSSSPPVATARKNGKATASREGA